MGRTTAKISEHGKRMANIMQHGKRRDNISPRGKSTVNVPLFGKRVVELHRFGKRTVNLPLLRHHGLSILTAAQPYRQGRGNTVRVEEPAKKYTEVEPVGQGWP